jgi:predicted regulator of Ras-like GTPase activity (Roadblock/LC7/MglB family)
VTTPTTGISAAASNFSWLISRFSRETAEVAGVIAVSSDGLLIGCSSTLERASADRLAAITSAVLSLAHGVSESVPIGQPDKVVIEMTEGFMLVCTISAGCALGVLATSQASLGTVAYETAVFANRASEVLSPQLVDELRYIVGYPP